MLRWTLLESVSKFSLLTCVLMLRMWPIFCLWVTLGFTGSICIIQDDGTRMNSSCCFQQAVPKVHRLVFFGWHFESCMEVIECGAILRINIGRFVGAAELRYFLRSKVRAIITCSAILRWISYVLHFIYSDTQIRRVHGQPSRARDFLPSNRHLSRHSIPCRS